MTEPGPINIEVLINAPVANTWQALTEPKLMKQWMFEEAIEIITDWKIGSPILIKGHLHEVDFENTGRILQFELYKTLSYEHLSSLSKLPDEPANYSVLEFSLSPMQNQTLLRIGLSNFPTESIYHHLKFYWRTTALILKKFIENTIYNNYNISMENKKNVLLIGIDPLLLDFSSPDFSAMPGLTAEVIETGTQIALKQLMELGYQAEKCWVDLGETAADVITTKLKSKAYDAVIVGAGIRAAESNFLLFEKLINVIHEHAPKAKICFNTSPKDNAAAVQRWV